MYFWDDLNFLALAFGADRFPCCTVFSGHGMLNDSFVGSDWQLQTVLRKENNGSFNNVSTLHYSSDNIGSRSDLDFRFHC